MESSSIAPMKASIPPESVSEYSLHKLKFHIDLYKLQLCLSIVFCRGSFFLFDGESRLPHEQPRKWLSQSFHYDNVATAMLTLFAVQTGEGWPQ